MKNTTKVKPKTDIIRLSEGGRRSAKAKIADRPIAEYVQAEIVKRTARGRPLTPLLLPILFNYEPYKFQITLNFYN